jgi:CBS domain-containing protein
MNVHDVMSRDVKLASPDDTLQNAAQMMEEIDAGVLPVGEGDRLVGMLTDRDITLRAVAKGKAPGECRVREVMSHDIKYIYEDASIEDAARNMGELQLRRLPVLNRNKRLVGIVSLGDLALEKSNDAGEALKGVAKH